MSVLIAAVEVIRVRLNLLDDGGGGGGTSSAAADTDAPHSIIISCK